MVQLAIALVAATLVTGITLPLLRRLAGDRPVGIALLALLPGFFVGAGSPALKRQVGILDEVDLGLLVPIALATVVALVAEARERSTRLLLGGAFVIGVVGWATGWGWGGLALPSVGLVDLEFLSLPFSAAVVVVSAAAFRATGPLDGIAGGLAIAAAIALAFLTHPGLDEPPATHAAALAGATLAITGWRLWSGRAQTDGAAGSYVVGILLALLASRCGANATGEPNPVALALVFAVPALALVLSRRGDGVDPGLLHVALKRIPDRPRALGALMATAVVLAVLGVVLGKLAPGTAVVGAPPLPTLQTPETGAP